MTKALSIVGSSRSNGEREKDDFYPTPSYAVDELLKREDFNGNIWECACGDGAISEVFLKKGFEVRSSDLIDRNYGIVENFFEAEYVAKKKSNGKIAMFLKTVFLESEKRRTMFEDKEFPLKTVYQFSKRVSLYKDGVKMKNSGMIAYAWYVWEKGYCGKPTIEWI
jgi:hypothetical protein